MTYAWKPSNTIVDFVSRKFGTPTYIYSKKKIESKFSELHHLLGDYSEIYYSLKANPNLSIVKTLTSLGAGTEVSSLVELHTALMSKVDNTKIILVGPGKSDEEISLALSSNIGAIVCESFHELSRVSFIQKTISPDKAKIMLRVNPTFKVKSKVLTMAGKPRQFGIDEGEIIKNKDKIKGYDNLEIIGFHGYMGTRFLDETQVAENTEKLLDLFSYLASILDIKLKKVDVGGGFGVPYYDNEKDFDITLMSNLLKKTFSDFKNLNTKCSIIIELGRYLVAESGVMISTVRDVKNSMGENFVITDGGMNVHLAASGMGSFSRRNFPIVNFSNENNDKKTNVNVTGPLCTPTDTVAKNLMVTMPKPGDQLGILMSGAYGPTASPVYFLSHGYPAEVMVDNDDIYIIRKRDGIQEILSPQIHDEIDKNASRYRCC